MSNPLERRKRCRPERRTCLVIGLGAAVIPTWYERQGVRTDVVDNPLDFYDAGIREAVRRETLETTD
jgi:hypothetical protein